MKKTLLLTVLMVIGMGWGTPSNAQAKLQLTPQMLQTAPVTKQYYSGAETIGKVKKSNRVQSRYPDQIIGTTFYDLQTNNTIMQRIVADGNGGCYATWTHSQDDLGNGWPDRGTGFNSYDGNVWAQDPADIERIEPERCGWSNIDMLSDGSVVVVSHSTASGRLYFSKLEKGATSWTGGLLDDGTGVGQVWSRMAVGGPDGNTIHVFTSTTPTALGGGPYRGVEGQPVYHRSLDGGKTWDKQDMILPGLDTSNYARFDNDAYAIAARGNVVAIALFGSWNDIAIWKSKDNGETWERILVNDFPLDKYVIGTAYTIDDIGGIDTMGPGGFQDPTEDQKMAVFTSDGSGYITIDPDGKCHVLFGEMYLTDTDFSDQSWSFYPAWPYLDYWNEDMVGQRPVRMFAPYDFDGDGSILTPGPDANIPRYFRSLASFPYITSDAEGTLFASFSMQNELFYENDDNEYFRHLYLSKSTDGGQTWDDPYDVINAAFYEGTGFESDTSVTEAIFSSLAVDDQNLYVVFQKDFDPALFIPQNSDDEVSEQEISFLKFDKNDLTLVERVVTPKVFRMNLTPNPATSGNASLQFEIRKAARIKVEMYDMNGQLIHRQKEGRLEAGVHRIKLNTDQLSGVYAVKLWVNKASTSKKLIIK